MTAHAIRWLVLAALFGAALFMGHAVMRFHSRHASFQQRWAPVLEKPLHHKGTASDGYCFPRLCRIV